MQVAEGRKRPYLIRALFWLARGRACIDLVCQVGQRGTRRIRIQGLVLFMPKDVREKLLLTARKLQITHPASRTLLDMQWPMP